MLLSTVPWGINRIILESGSMLKQLDVALQQYATQQQKQQADQVHYVAKVQSKTTSRRYL